MGVDYFWKRVPVETVGGTTPKELAELVPYWFDEDFTGQRDARLVVGAEDTGALVEALIGMGAAGTTWEPAARAFCSPLADWDDYRMVGTVDTETVSLVADLLATAPVDTWAAQHRADLAEYVRELGYHRPFDDEWAEQVVVDIRELAELFRAAATAREAIILKIVA
jgi:hypothetical protein